MAVTSVPVEVAPMSKGKGKIFETEIKSKESKVGTHKTQSVSPKSRKSKGKRSKPSKTPKVKYEGMIFPSPYMPTFIICGYQGKYYFECWDYDEVMRKQKREEKKRFIQ